MKIEQVKTSELKPYGRNNRKHPPEQIDKLMKQIQAHGWDVPIVADKDLVIIKGHARLVAAKKLKLKTVPVIVRADLTPEQCNAARLADNKLGELAEIDMEAIQAELDSLKDADFDLDLTAFDSWTPFAVEEEQGTEGLTDPDDVPEVKPDPKSKLGDVWLLGDHRVMCGDSTDAASVAILMNGQKADMVWTDPPYNVALGMDETPEEAKKRNRRTDGLVVKNDKMSDSDFRAFLTTVFKNYYDNTNKGSAIYVAHSDSEGYNFRGAIKDTGWLQKQCLIWVKSSLVMGRQDYQWRHEPILYGWKEGASHNWYSDRKQSTVLEFDKPSRNEFHPTMKPIELVTYCINNSSKSYDLVIDLFLGSGSTLIACEKTGRKCFGMELSPNYVDVIVKRWQDFTGKKAVREDGVEFDSL